jgi:H+/Cl- antiporter ClcA
MFFSNNQIVYDFSNQQGDFYEPNDNIFVNRFEEVPFYVLTGVVGGLLGGFFSVVLEFRKRRMKHILSGKVSKLIEVMVLSIFTSFLLFYVSSMEWTCRDIVDKEKYEAVNGKSCFSKVLEKYSLSLMIFLFAFQISGLSILLQGRPGQFASHNTLRLSRSCNPMDPH